MPPAVAVNSAVAFPFGFDSAYSGDKVAYEGELVVNVTPALAAGALNIFIFAVTRSWLPAATDVDAT